MQVGVRVGLTPDDGADAAARRGKVGHACSARSLVALGGGGRLGSEKLGLGTEEQAGYGMWERGGRELPAKLGLRRSRWQAAGVYVGMSPWHVGMTGHPSSLPLPSPPQMGVRRWSERLQWQYRTVDWMQIGHLCEASAAWFRCPQLWHFSPPCFPFLPWTPPLPACF